MWPRPKISSADAPPANRVAASRRTEAEEPALLPGSPPWLEHAGPVATVVLIVALEITASRHFNIPNPPALLVLTVVFSAFVGNFRAGLISAGLALIYFCHALAERGTVLDFNKANLQQLIVWSVVLTRACGLSSAKRTRAIV